MKMDTESNELQPKSTHKEFEENSLMPPLKSFIGGRNFKQFSQKMLDVGYDERAINMI